MAAIGVCSICAPWYIGRIIFRKYDFCGRAMVGQSAWVCDEVLCLVTTEATRSSGHHYMHKACGGMAALRSTFWHFDTVLHLIAALVLLQQYAWSIRPIHSLGSLAVTLGWFGGLFYDHKVWDMEAVRGGHLRLRQWGSTSLWEPVKMAQIYMFKNTFIAEDGAWEAAVPGFASIIVVAHVLLAVVASLPNAGDIFFALGLGPYVSTQSLFYFGGYCFLGAGVSVTIGGVQLARSILSDAEDKASKSD